MNISKTLLAATAALFVASGAAMAAEAGATAPAKTAKVHSPESIACSKEADTKNLHGDARKTFRAECKKKMKAGEKVTAPKTEAPKATAPAAPKAPAPKVTAPKS